MNILIAGASGFIGRALVAALSADHQITVLGRSLKTLHALFSKDIHQLSWQDLSKTSAQGFDLIINLSGYNISERRWNDAVKKELIDSRVNSNKELIHWLIEHNARPRYMCANAVGIYGLQSNGEMASFDEDTVIDSKNTHDFLSTIGMAWQESLSDAINYGIPVTTLRFGVVLKKGDGMLKKLELPFKLGLGHVLGDGSQTLSWVHLDDVISAIVFLIQQPQIIGAVNITAPQPVSQKEFASTLARTLKRPMLLKMPAAVIQLMFGEMGECLLLKGQRVVPKRLIDLGYAFKYPTLSSALEAEYST